MTKSFRLNISQIVNVSISHPLYSDILAAQLTNQDIEPILKKLLIKKRFINVFLKGFLIGSFWVKKDNINIFPSIIDL